MVRVWWKFYNYFSFSPNSAKTPDAFKVFIRANNFLPQLYDVFPAADRLVHVCAAVLPAQSESATPEDPRSVLLSSVLVAVAQNGAFPCGHAAKHFQQRWIHVSN